MGIVYIDDLGVGMVLASDLLGSGGRMLLPAGVALQEGHQKTLKAWGVTEVDIEDTSQGEVVTEAKIDSEALQQGQDYLQAFFAQTDLAHPAMAELFRFAYERTAKQIASRRELLPLPWTEPAVVKDSLLADDFWQKAPKKAEDLFRGTVELASLPDVYSQIVEVMNSPRSSAAQLAEMVSKDTSLASRLLKLVNSAFYGFPSRIDSITRAVTLIGTNELTTMALGISVVNAFKDIPGGLMSVEGFWRHSIACGIFARLLAAHKIGTSAEQLFVGGLLHDIGRMVMLQQIPAAYAEVLKQARREQTLLVVSEKQLLGFDHTDVGCLLCKEWRFSKALEEMINCHHLPGRGRYALNGCLIHLADIMAKVYFVGQAECGCVMISSLQEKAWDSLGLSPSVLLPIFSQAERQIHEIVKLFLSPDKA